ncbi:hypothetical protein [Desulfobulbus propionicus]|uniref:hypothetical protein n=1 Tax=Desulfobulbus propionicus TaxID=894 RepID=UPI00146EDFD0|nr:hypothetical protein [Desulfobulbus propionicus]
MAFPEKRGGTVCMGPEFYVEQSLLAKIVVSTEVDSGAWGYSVGVGMISISMFSTPIAHRWSNHRALHQYYQMS